MLYLCVQDEMKLLKEDHEKELQELKVHVDIDLIHIADLIVAS